MTMYVTWLLRACNELSLDAELDFVLTIRDGRNVHALARIMGIGAPNGMLLLESGKDLQNGVSEEILRAGYGYSIFDEPRPGEEFDLESFREMFSDWGWGGEADKRPNWMG